MDDEHGLDPMLPVVRQHLAHRQRIGAAAPVGVQGNDVEAESGRHLLPQMGELAGAGDQYAVAFLQRVDQRRFPGPGAGGGEDADDTLGAEHRAEFLDDLPPQGAEFRAAVVDGVAVHRAQHAIGQVGRAWRVQEVPAGYEM